MGYARFICFLYLPCVFHIGTFAGNVIFDPYSQKIIPTNPAASILDRGLSVIDSITLKREKTIALPVDFGLSAAAAFNPKNQQTYVSSYNDSSTLLYVMNDTTDRLINRFDIGTIRSPIQTMAVNPSTNNIYLIKDGSDNLTIIDGITGQPKGEIHVDKRPTAIDIYAEHNLKYIANSDSNTISIIDGIKNEVLVGCSLTLYLLNQGTFTA